MAPNINDRELLTEENSLDEPHFDEEATLLSARPVVPLDEVKAKTGLPRGLIYGLVILIGLMVGAGGAVLVYQQWTQKNATAVDSRSSVSEHSPEEESSITGVGGAPVDWQAAAAGVNEGDSAPRQAPKADDVATSNKKETRAPSRSADETTAKSDQEEPQLDPIDTLEDVQREILRADRKEAKRRARRVERRAAKRGDKDQSDDDLLRIREIFEGAPRP
jgi:hypothetical protein